jgi:hypothetical protein
MNTRLVPGKLTYSVYGFLFSLIAITVIIALIGAIDKFMARRIMGGLFGLIMIVSGNFLPKMIRPWQVSYHKSLFQRLTGWILVLSGLGMVGAMSMASDEMTPILTAFIALSGLFISAAMVIFGKWQDRNHKNQDYDLPNDDFLNDSRQVSIQRALVHILNAMAWVCVMFAAELIWGSNSLNWILIGYVISIAIIPTPLKAKKSQ